MCENSTPIKGRVIGFDCHPDSFTAAIIVGPTSGSAIIEKMFNKVPLGRIKTWAKEHMQPEDLVVLEASGNSFQVVRTLASIGRKAVVVESCHMGKLKEHHANNDKISAVRIGKAYLAGTAKLVWVPDQKTQERRDLFHMHRKVVKRTTQMRNRILSYLSDNGVRLPKNTRLASAGVDLIDQIQKAHTWTPWQWRLLQGLILELQHAEEQRAHWRSLIAQEVISDPLLLSIVRLTGVRDLIAFALGAIIGDITRFKEPKKLVKYVGLHPAFDQSGENQWSGGLIHHGRKDLRSLLVEAAQSILRSSSPLAHWGKKLLGRKGQVKLVVAAIARKLTVAVWYLMMGKWTTLKEIDSRLQGKISKIITHAGNKVLKEKGITRKQMREQIYQTLKNKRDYVLEPNRNMSMPG